MLEDENNPTVSYVFQYYAQNHEPNLSPRSVEMELDNAFDMDVDTLLEHFSRFLVTCGFAKYTFGIVKND